MLAVSTRAVQTRSVNAATMVSGVSRIVRDRAADLVERVLPTARRGRGSCTASRSCTARARRLEYTLEASTLPAWCDRHRARQRASSGLPRPDFDIPEPRKDDHRLEIMNDTGALAMEGKKFGYETNDRLRRVFETKLFEDQKDSIKLSSFVSSDAKEQASKGAPLGSRGSRYRRAGARGARRRT